MKKLKKKLLELGGERFQVDWFIKQSLTKTAMNCLAKCGVAIINPQIRIEQGERNRCHDNAEKLTAEKGYDCMTGFALSDDGIWRLHSWCLDGKIVIETTMPRVIYYGLPTILTERQQ